MHDVMHERRPNNTVGIIACSGYMSDQDQKLCDNCHERPGTNHICYGGRADEGRSLCQICLMQDLEVGGLMQRFNEAMRTRHCRYCGAPAENSSGGGSSVEGDHFKLQCKACHEDLADFAGKFENAIQDVPPDYKTAMRDEESMKQRIRQLTDRMQQQEEFMKKRVLERRSRGDA
jgi:hypothetical protein